MRTKVAEIRETGRNAAGVKLIRVDEGDKLVAMAKVDAEEADPTGSTAVTPTGEAPAADAPAGDAATPQASTDDRPGDGAPPSGSGESLPAPDADPADPDAPGAE
jgi:DNA gyrase subunit A